MCICIYVYILWYILFEFYSILENTRVSQSIENAYKILKEKAEYNLKQCGYSTIQLQFLFNKNFFKSETVDTIFESKYTTNEDTEEELHNINEIPNIGEY